VVKTVDGRTDHAAAQALYRLDEFVGQYRLTSCIDTVNCYADRMRTANPSDLRRKILEKFRSC